MEGFRPTFINEIEKLYKRKNALLAAVFSIIVIVICQLLAIFMKGIGGRISNSTQFPIFTLSLFANTILPLFTALTAIDIFAGEFSQSTMRIVLTRPVTRLKVFMAKITAVAFFVLANLLFVMVLSLLSGLIFNTVSLTAAGFIRIIVSYLAIFVPVIALALMVVFFANIIKSGATVFFLSIVIYLAFKGMGLMFPHYSSFFITSMFDWYNLWAIDPLPLMKLIRQLLIMTGYGIMFFTAGYYLFDKKNL